ncbi:MAG: 3-phosphoshikimate 1-carboxyvinyltransferase [Candidatus Aminicenantes bacterium]|nr:3-phosphoshikimate 1-carboxyvinyltransferase [Candidatus Aminicenantes bacterium]
MKYVNPSVLNGALAAPPSKSLTQRAAAAAFLSPGTTEIINASSCADAMAAFRLIEEMGAEVDRSGAESAEKRIRIHGGSAARRRRVQCGEAGLCLRMFTPILSLFEGPVTLEASGSLLNRPMGMMEKPLSDLGGRVETREGRPPVTVWGPIRGGRTEVDGSVSSQFLSGLLLALPRAEQPSEVAVRNLKSRSYVEMTLGVIRAFGGVVENASDLSSFRVPGGQVYRAGTFRVEGDWSGAAALLAAAALSGRVEVSGLDPDSLQPDRAVLSALEAAGARVGVSKNRISCERADLRPFEFDVGECPDLFPTLAALAARCAGTSVIRGIERLRHKESARDHVVREEFSKIGVEVEISGGAVRIRGGRIRGGRADAHGDHRIAMTLALAGLASETGVGISGTDCVVKSYPEFFKDLRRLGGRIS